MGLLMRLAQVLVLAAVLGPASDAASQTAGDSKEVRDLARTLATRGLELLEAGKPDEAIEALRRANDIYRAPTILLQLARAYDKANRLIEARDTYREILEMDLPPKSSVEFLDAQRTAKGELESLQKTMPVLDLSAAGFKDPVEFSVDERPVAAAGRVEVDPGTHRVRAVGADGARSFREVTVSRGAVERVALEAPARAEATPVESGPSGWLIASISLFSLGGAAGIAGAVTGGLAIDRADEFRAQCPASPCDPRAQVPYDEADAFATASTATLVTAGGLAGVGLALLIVELARPGTMEAASLRPGRGPLTFEF